MNLDEPKLRSKVLSRMERLKLTQTSLANLAEVPRENLCKWLGGHRSFSLESLTRVLSACGMALELREVK